MSAFKQVIFWSRVSLRDRSYSSGSQTVAWASSDGRALFILIRDLFTYALVMHLSLVVFLI